MGGVPFTVEDDEGVSEGEFLALGDPHQIGFAFAVGEAGFVAAEGVGGHQAVAAGVPAGAVGVGGVIENCDGDRLAIDLARIGAPVSLAAPDILLAGLAQGVAELAALLLGEGIDDSDAHGAFLGVLKGDGAFGGAQLECEVHLPGGGTPSTEELDVKYHRMTVCPPIGKDQRYGPLELTVIHATERGTPYGREPIRWKLVTNLPVACKADAIEKLDWYALRWKIEMFHKVMKSGCRAEDSWLRTAARLANLIAMMCIVAWRVLWLTMLKITSMIMRTFAE